MSSMVDALLAGSPGFKEASEEDRQLMRRAANLCGYLGVLVSIHNKGGTAFRRSSGAISETLARVMLPLEKHGLIVRDQKSATLTKRGRELVRLWLELPDLPLGGGSG